MKKMIIDLKLLVAAVTVGLVLGNQSCCSLKSNEVIESIKDEEVGDVNEEKKDLASTIDLTTDSDEDEELAEVVIAEWTEVIKEKELSANMKDAVSKYKGEFTKLSNAASNLDFSNLSVQFRKSIREELTNVKASIEVCT